MVERTVQRSEAKALDEEIKAQLAKVGSDLEGMT
jgi:hypothetical protein